MFDQLRGVLFVFYAQIKSLCDMRGEKLTPLILKLGLSRGNLQNWQNGATVNSDILCIMADYFNVSVDYLLGRTDKPEVNR
jgi:transcriptional regulator with XRE-family HTH domain